MTDWQPIETAPKDGTLILGYYPCDAAASFSHVDPKVEAKGIRSGRRQQPRIGVEANPLDAASRTSAGRVNQQTDYGLQH